MIYQEEVVLSLEKQEIERIIGELGSVLEALKNEAIRPRPEVQNKLLAGAKVELGAARGCLRQASLLIKEVINESS